MIRLNEITGDCLVGGVHFAECHSGYDFQIPSPIILNPEHCSLKAEKQHYVLFPDQHLEIPILQVYCDKIHGESPLQMAPLNLGTARDVKFQFM